MLHPGGFIDGGALSQYLHLLPPVALARGDELDAAVAVLLVVTGDEVGDPGARRFETLERSFEIGRGIARSGADKTKNLILYRLPPPSYPPS